MSALLLPFPVAVDSSMMSTFRACPQKFFRMHLQHWKPQAESVHLVAGKAYASGLEAARRAYYEQGASAEDAEARGAIALIKEYGQFECPADSAKSLERMLGALAFYFDKYPLDSDAAQPVKFASGARAIEFSFAHPLEIVHPVTGDPILYTGRSDMIVEYAGGQYILDDKTTKQLGASWAGQWEMRSQFTGYTWAAQQLPGLEGVRGTLVRGVSILKTKYDTLQALTYRSDYEVARWYNHLHRSLRAMIVMWQRYNQLALEYPESDNAAAFDYNLDASCNEYGGCPLERVCKSPEPEQWLPMYFEKRVWDPLAREERKVEVQAP